MKNWILSIIVMFATAAPALPAFAAVTHHYTCSDFDTYQNASCLGDVITFSTSAADSWAYDAGAHAPTLSAGTWYVSLTYTGSGNLYFQFEDPATSQTTVTSSIIAQAITVSGSGFNVYFDNFDGGTPRFVGDVADICVTDTSGDCEIAPDPGTSTSTALTADFTGIYLFLAFFVFYAMMYFTVIVMRKR